MVWRRRRYLVALLAFFGFMNVYSLRVNLSVAIVAMNSTYTVILPNGTEIQVIIVPFTLQKENTLVKNSNPFNPKGTILLI